MAAAASPVRAREAAAGPGRGAGGRQRRAHAARGPKSGSSGAPREPRVSRTSFCRPARAPRSARVDRAEGDSLKGTRDEEAEEAEAPEDTRGGAGRAAPGLRVRANAAGSGVSEVTAEAGSSERWKAARYVAIP